MSQRDDIEKLKLDRMEKLLATASESIQNLVLDGEDFKKLARSTVKLTLKGVQEYLLKERQIELTD